MTNRRALISEKIRQAIALCNEFDLDCWLTFVRESGINGDPALALLADGGLTWHSAIIVHRDGETCAIVGRYDKPSLDALGVYDTVVGYVEGIKTPFVEHFKRKNPRTIGVNFSKGSEICDGLTMGMYLTLQDLLDACGRGWKKRLVSAERLVSALRERKSPTELARIQAATDETMEIWSEIGAYLRPGLRESEVAAFVHGRIAARGLEPGWEAAHCPAVYSGLGEAEAHTAPGEKLLKKGEVVNLDFGVRKDGYVSDTQRIFYLLDEGETAAPPEVMRAFETITEAIEAGKQAMRPGVQAFEIDKIVRGRVTAAGYEEYPHGTGHQLGIFVHDGTALLGPLWEKYAEKPLQRLEAGMVFTIEPRVKVQGRGIVSIEEMAVVTAEGAEWVTRPQRELVLIKS